MTIEQNILTPGDDWTAGLWKMDQYCKDLKFNPTRSRGNRFWRLLNEVFGQAEVDKAHKKIGPRAIQEWHALYKFCENKDRKGVLNYLHKLGFRFNNYGVHLAPVSSTEVFEKLDTTIRNLLTDEKRRITSDTEFIHKGSVSGMSQRGKTYDNRRQLRDQGVWGNPDSWNYVGTAFVSCGSGHMNEHALLFVGKAKLIALRDMFIDPEAITKQYEFGHTFMFRGGIPLEAITKIEIPRQEDPRYPVFTEITATYTPEEFVELAA